MTEIRTLPDGSLQIRHPDLNGWLSLMAPIRVENGWPVILAAPQSEVLTEIGLNTHQLPEIGGRLVDLKTDLAALRLLVAEINQFKVTDIVRLLDSIKVADEAVASRLQILVQQLQGPVSVTALLQRIETKILDYSGSLELLHQDLASLQALVTALNGGISGIIGSQNRFVSSTPSIQNLKLTNADQQYSYLAPAGTKRLSIKCRNSVDQADPVADVRFAWQTGKVAPATGAGPATNDYDVIAAQIELEESGLFLTSDTLLYFASSIAGVVLSIRRWS